jgi:hypothetical protein
MQLLEQSPRTRTTPEQPEVVAEHHDGVERAGVESGDVFERKESRVLDATRLRRLHDKWRVVDPGDVESLSL